MKEVPRLYTLTPLSLTRKKNWLTNFIWNVSFGISPHEVWKESNHWSGVPLVIRLPNQLQPPLTNTVRSVPKKMYQAKQIYNYTQETESMMKRTASNIDEKETETVAAVTSDISLDWSPSDAPSIDCSQLLSHFSLLHNNNNIMYTCTYSNNCKLRCRHKIWE